MSTNLMKNWVLTEIKNWFCGLLLWRCVFSSCYWDKYLCGCKKWKLLRLQLSKWFCFHICCCGIKKGQVVKQRIKNQPTLKNNNKELTVLYNSKSFSGLLPLIKEYWCFSWGIPSLGPGQVSLVLQLLGTGNCSEAICVTHRGPHAWVSLKTTGTHLWFCSGVTVWTKSRQGVSQDACCSVLILIFNQWHLVI